MQHPENESLVPDGFPPANRFMHENFSHRWIVLFFASLAPLREPIYHQREEKKERVCSPAKFIPH